MLRNSVGHSERGVVFVFALLTARSHSSRFALISCIADSAATPINLLDWHAQQKTLKDQERMSKTQTAEFLHNYRGKTPDAASILAQQKLEDRMQKETAAKLLHSYRGDGTMVGTLKSPAKTGATGVAPSLAQQQTDQRTGEETVAFLVAGFSQNGDTAPELAHPTSMFMPPPAPSADESIVMVGTPPQPQGALPLETLVTEASTEELARDGMKEEDWVSVESSNVPSTAEVEDMLAQSALEHQPEESFDSNDDAMSRAVTEVAGNIEDDDTVDMDFPPRTEAQLHATSAHGRHVSLRLDVEFSFGLVSRDVPPNAEKYTISVSRIAHAQFAENRPAGSGGGHAIYNPVFTPFVRFVEDDLSWSRSDGARRFIVHASLPMFILDWGEAASTRIGVRDALRTALEDGRFLSLAL